MQPIAIDAATEEAKSYYTCEYSDEDYKQIAAYFGRDIAAAIYRKNVTDEVRRKMKAIVIKQSTETPKNATPAAVVKALEKEL